MDLLLRKRVQQHVLTIIIEPLPRAVPGFVEAGSGLGLAPPSGRCTC